MRTVAIIQARMGSTRLPGKAMLPLAGKSMTQNIIERVRRATKLDYVVLSFPLTDAEAFIPVLLSQHNTPGVPFGSYAAQGDENDLVSRYLNAAQYYNADIVVRIPGDNPCVDGEFIDEAIEHYLRYAHPFVSNADHVTSCAGRPAQWYEVDGLGAEVFSLSRLKWLERITAGHATLREHPHKWFYDNLCVARTSMCPNRLINKIRLDVNDSKDYEFVKMIYDHFGHNRFHISEVLAYLDATRQLAS